MSGLTYQSIGYVTEHLAKWGRNDIDHFLELRGVPGDELEKWGPMSSKKGLVRAVLRDLLRQEQLGTLKRIIEGVLPSMEWKERDRLENALKAEGFIVTDDGKLTAGPVELFTERTTLEVLIDQNNSLSQEVLLHHLEQGHELYTQGNWGASIGQGRNFIEQLLLDIAFIIAERKGEKPNVSKPVLVRNYLLETGFLEKDERNRLVDGIYGYLSEEGSHPGISDQKVAHISRILSLTVGQYLLEKLGNFP